MSRELTANQRRQWFLHRYEDDPSVYNITRVVRLTGPVDDGDVRRAIEAAISRHPVLRSRIESTAGGLRQSLVTGKADGIEWSDLSAVDDSDSAHREIRRREHRRRLSLDDGGSVHAHLVKIGDDERWLYLSMHPCVADDKTARVVLREVVETLQGADPQDEDVGFISLVDHARTIDAASIRYWVDRIGSPETLALPTFQPRPSNQRFEAHASRFEVPAEVARNIRAIAEQQGTSVDVVCFAAFIVLLRRWTQQDTVVVGRRVDTRDRACSRAAGPFENMVPYRADLGAAVGFSSFLNDVVQRLSLDRRHAELQFADMIENLDIDRDPARSPLFQAVFAAQDAPLRMATERFTASEVDSEEPRTGYDIELGVALDEPGVSGEVRADAAVFDPEMATTFARHFIELLTNLASDPALDVDAVGCLGADERRRQLEDFNPAPAAVPLRCLANVFRDAVRSHANDPAVTFTTDTLTYDELDRLSNRIARWLMGAGVKKDVCVGVCLDRSIEMVATVLAILKAGGAYVPMDPSYPPERLAMMAQDADARIIVANERYTAQLPTSCRILVGETLAATVRDENDGPIDLVPSADSLAYVIFTSGSTGRPKGVAMPHRALVNLIEWQLARAGFRHAARVLQYSSLSFDVSFQEIFSTFASGGHLFLIGDEARRDPRALLDVIHRCSIDRLFLPYVALRQLIGAAHATNRYPATLREVITAGEQLRVDDGLRSFFKRIRGAALDNQYGPSETHVVTAHMLRGDPDAWPILPPIGRPVTNNQAFVLGARGGLLPIGAPGELYLAGVNLARGYVGRDDLTRERFIEHPFSDDASARLYQTGDLARYRADGTIEFLGRADEQVKIRGYRIEPGEIDAVLAEIPGVRQCLTRVFDDPGYGRRLASYLRVDDTESFDTHAVKRFAKQRLPDYMVPDAVVCLESFPFTPSGKVDARSLPLPDARTLAAAATFVAPTTQTQSALAEVWQEILGLERVSAEDSFFDLGGDSLKAVDLFLAIEQRFGEELPLSVLGESPTIASLGALIDGDAGDAMLTGFRALRRIQRGDDSRAPLFLVHGGGGNVVLFNALAKNVDAGLPVYAFQWSGWSGDRGEQTIEEMVDLYHRELTQFWPQGPVRIGGHCIGGVVAIELANRLRASGYEVLDPLIVTDSPNLAATTYRPLTPAPPSPALDGLRSELSAKIERCPPMERRTPVRRVRRSRLPVVLQPLRRLYWRMIVRRMRRWWARRKPVFDRIRVRMMLWTGAKIPLDLRQTYSAMSMIHAVKAFKPSTYPGHVLYFRTGLYLGENLGLEGWWSDLYLGFGELVVGAFTVTFINAEHNEITAHPRTAQVIREAIGEQALESVRVG